MTRRIKKAVASTQHITKFEKECGRLHLQSRTQMVNSEDLKEWVERFKDTFYVPTWLLAEWHLTDQDTDRFGHSFSERLNIPPVIVAAEMDEQEVEEV